MSKSILTPDEISALMRQHQSSVSTEEDLTVFFKPMLSLLQRQFTRLLGLDVIIDPFYIQRIVDNLEDVVYSKSYVMPLELSLGEILVLTSEKNGKSLSNYLGVPIDEALALIVKESGIVLAQFLSEKVNKIVKATTHQSTLMNAEQVAALPMHLPGYVINFSLSFNNVDLEFKFFLPYKVSQTILSLTNDSSDVSEQISGKHKVTVESFQFSELKPETNDLSSNMIELVDDVTVEIRAELGSVNMTLGQLMELEEGDTVTLNKVAGDLADVFINEQNIAKAEVTVLDDNFGLRIVEIVPIKDRINS